MTVPWCACGTATVRSPEHRPAHRAVVWVAGWLFADLTLVLFVLGLASQPPERLAGTGTSASAIPSAPTPPPASAPDRLDTDPVLLSITAGFGELSGGAQDGLAAAAAVSQVDRELTARHLTGRRAGMVLTWASAPTYQISGAIEAARTINAVLHRRSRPFADAAMKPLWDGSGGVGEFRLEIYFYA
jgi:hypothetical protein